MNGHPFPDDLSNRVAQWRRFTYFEDPPPVGGMDEF